MIYLRAFPVVKTTGGNRYLLGTGMEIDSWPNDYFDDKHDIFDENEWVDFIANYTKFGKKLPVRDENGDYYMYCITVTGPNRLMKDHMGVGGKAHGFFYLFPKRLRMNPEDKTQPMLDYNRKYIWPRLK